MNSINTKLPFVELGKFLSQFTIDKQIHRTDVLYNSLYFEKFKDLIALSQSHNGWFTPEQVYFSLQSWAEALTEENLNYWLSNYDFSNVESKTVGLILAGNIPLVGFHDFMSVLISGHKALVKTSSNDQHLIKFLSDYMITVEPKLSSFIFFTDGKLENFDAMIATGSNNTARYFEFYFKNKPSIIRRSRNSVAVLNGKETHDDLVNLSEDIFRYFGLGCRNVSKLFLPKDYNFEAFFQAMYEQKDVIYYEKYSNNYDYNKAVFLMSNFKLLDNEFLTLKDDPSYASPISSVFYEYYDDLSDLQRRLTIDAEQIQCIVSNNLIENSIDFGQTQKPKLWDYSDNVDTLQFLASLNDSN